MKKSSIIGLLTISGIFLYISQRKREGNQEEGIQGIDIGIKPETLANSIIDNSNISPLKKELIKSGARSFLNSYNRVKMR